VSEEEIVTLLDYPAYFDLAEIPLPENRSQLFNDCKRKVS
jgi:ATP-dependent DNA helicase RecG